MGYHMKFKYILLLNMHAHCFIIGLNNMTRDTEIPFIYISDQPRFGSSCIVIKQMSVNLKKGPLGIQAIIT